MDFRIESENCPEDDSESDTDDIEEIKSLFAPCQHVSSHSLGPKYVLHISCSSDSNPYVAAALSDYSCDVFSLTESQVVKIGHLTEHTDQLINCQFSYVSSSLLYTASSDGSVKLWDIRDINKSAVTFLDTTLDKSSSIKTLSSFDVSRCNRLLAAGTDLVEGDAYILFWDIRNTTLLGAYWESHTDDITQVKFHPNNSNKLMSGATDGLINIYNLLEISEDDALQECLNTEVSVEDLQWFCDKIICVTSTNDLQLWETDGAEPYRRFSRAEVALNIKKKTEAVYVAKVHPYKDSLLVLSGSNGHEGKSLRSFQISNGTVSPGYRFDENSQRVRASWVNEQINILLTGGEKGKLDIWKPHFGAIDFKAFKRK